MEFLDGVGNLCLTFEETASFPKVAIHIFHSHQQCYEGSHFSLHPCPHLVLIFFMIIAILVGVRVVVHCGFNLTNDDSVCPKDFQL